MCMVLKGRRMFRVLKGEGEKKRRGEKRRKKGEREERRNTVSYL